jgi:cephalosporin hydroxylase
MKLIIDTITGEITGDGEKVGLYTDEGFKILSKLWLKVGWNQKHIYTFTWLGRPIIQLPEDMIRMQEAVFQIKPTLIIETGIAHGGSLIFNASLLKAMGIEGRVIGIDIDIRAHNRKAIEEHFLFPYITLIEGSSVAPEVVEQVRNLVKPDDVVLVILDSNHLKAHVLAELEAYAPMVTKNSYIVATDGIMRDLTDVPRGLPEWENNTPADAAREFAASRPEFALDTPDWLFNESNLTENINTHYPEAWLKRSDANHLNLGW